MRFALSFLFVLAAGGPGFAQPSAIVEKSRAAAQAMSAGRFDEAASLYRDILESRPDDPGMLTNLGMALAMGGREAQAIAPLAQAVKLNPAHVPAQMFLGTSYLALGKPDLAIAPLERVVAMRPADVEALGTLAESYLAAGQLDPAVARFRRLTTIAPRSAGAWFGLGQAYNAIAQQGLETFNTEPDGSPWQMLLLANALEGDNRLPEAFTAYRQALASMPHHAVHDGLIRVYERTGHADWAAQQRLAAARVPSDCVTQKAACEFRAGRLRSALAATAGRGDVESRYWRTRSASELARQAFAQLDKLPDSRERREFRAELARSQGRHQDAVTEFEAALRFANDDPRLRVALATSQLLARDYERALATATPLLKGAPDDPILLTLCGDALLQLQRLDEALPLLEKAARIDASNPSVQAALGRAYVQKGQFASAIPLLVPRLVDDEDGSLHVQLARAYQGTGQADRAAPLLEKARALQQAAQSRSAASTEGKITPPQDE